MKGGCGMGCEKSTSDFIGVSSVAKEINCFAQKAAASDLTVLLCGETGVGKDYVAEQIHYLSGRSGPFVMVNCGALLETLAESELFGHVRGAFTGAIGAKKGLVTLANEGTLFLNEIANMSLALQAKLLSVLERRTCRPVGGAHEVAVNARFIVGTNADLDSMVQEGKFRKDLFYRLNVVPFLIPPLHKRKEDIPHLVAHFLKDGPKRFSAGALRVMGEYDWPGNIRQLWTLVKRAEFMSEEIEIGEDLVRPWLTDRTGTTISVPPMQTFLFHAPNDPPPFFKNVEMHYFGHILKLARGNIVRAAQLAGMSRRVMDYRIKKLELDKTWFK